MMSPEQVRRPLLMFCRQIMKGIVECLEGNNRVAKSNRRFLVKTASLFFYFKSCEFSSNEDISKYKKNNIIRVNKNIVYC
jgi:hypothetical protein